MHFQRLHDRECRGRTWSTTTMAQGKLLLGAARNNRFKAARVLDYYEVLPFKAARIGTSEHSPGRLWHRRRAQLPRAPATAVTGGGVGHAVTMTCKALCRGSSPVSSRHNMPCRLLLAWQRQKRVVVVVATEATRVSLRQHTTSKRARRVLHGASKDGEPKGWSWRR